MSLKMIANVATRAAAVSMTVYLTNYIGVWGPAADSERLLKCMSEPVGAMIKWMASTEESSWHANDAYNRGVKKIFEFIGHLPEHISDKFEAYTTGAKEARLANEERANVIHNLWHPEMMQFLEMLEERLNNKDSHFSEGAIKKAAGPQRLVADGEAAPLKQQVNEEADAEADAEAEAAAEEKKSNLVDSSKWSMWQYWKNQMLYSSAVRTSK